MLVPEISNLFNLSNLAVNDVCIHPNQGELISCDQAGSIKQWDLSDNICSHELVNIFSPGYPAFGLFCPG